MFEIFVGSVTSGNMGVGMKRDVDVAAMFPSIRIKTLGDVDVLVSLNVGLPVLAAVKLHPRILVCNNSPRVPSVVILPVRVAPNGPDRW